jgi:hypothetical protein
MAKRLAVHTVGACQGGATCKPWLSELDEPEWQELAGDRLGWRKTLKTIKIRTELVLQVQDRRWIERKMPR